MNASDAPYAVEMRQIHKQFGSVSANSGVDFFLRTGQIHALLGENGAGKTTLMRILFGLYRADSGEIRVQGEPAQIHSPKDALRLGIGMVTQHFALVPTLSVTENIVLGATNGFRLDLADARRKVAEASERFGIAVEPRALVRDLSVGQRQRVEILKALYRQATVLVLDEPTAVLTPQEVNQLFESLRRLQKSGLSVVFISHKLHEVIEITDQVTVLRGGEVAGVVATQETTRGELARMMVGRPTFGVTRPGKSMRGDSALKLDCLTVRNNKGLLALKEVSLDVRAGEIVGLAGVSGNGQVELAQALEGTRRAASGRILALEQDITNMSPTGVMAAGVGRIPEDGRANVVSEMSVAQNMVIEHLDEFTTGGRLDQKRIRRHAEKLIRDYQIKASPDDKIRTLSGGNMQKVVLARVLERQPKVIVVSQPTRGLDVGATEYVRSKLLEQRGQGAAILLISEDLDEILQLSDRIAVIYEGEIMDVLPVEEADIQRLGLLMSGVRAQPGEELV
ncbi:MAG: ABC transporter ATP-binding protein [Anaerolineae bacterium]